MSQLTRSTALITVLSTIMLGACGNAEATETTAPNASQQVAAREQAKLAGSPNDSWINLTGKVVSAGPDSFLLDYGKGNITVEMDDWDWYGEGKTIKAGDDVVVTGRVDDDLFQARRIEASSVYVRNLGTFFYANGGDEEDWVHGIVVTPVATMVEATGKVTAVEGREFTLGSGANAIRIDTARLANNPLDDTGYQKVKVGDRVHVWGDLDLDAGERGEVMAKGVVTLAKDRTAQL